MNAQSQPTFEELAERFLDGCRRGEALSVHEYAQQYPEHAEQLLQTLPLLMELEGLGKGDTMAWPKNTLAVSDLPEENTELPVLKGSDFRLLRRMDSGGMGTVFEAVQISLNRKSAVKVLSPTLFVDPFQRQLFENESRLIAMLHHPNIVQVFGAGSADGVCYYAMELIDGTRLVSTSSAPHASLPESVCRQPRRWLTPTGWESCTGTSNPPIC